MFALTRRHMPPTEILRLVDRVIFNVLACNTDAHAKNYSVMISGNGVSLAPMYDVMCAAVWENVTKNLVHKIGGSSRGDQLQSKHWRQFARECGFAEIDVAAMPAGGHPILSQVREAILDRARVLLEPLQGQAAQASEPINVENSAPA
jgi:serine/threonine-protein kinase HipA